MPSKSNIKLESDIIENNRYDDLMTIKDENFDTGESNSTNKDSNEFSREDSDEDTNNEEPIANLPLEVITTVEHYNIPYVHNLKNMSNGVLTHRNIFTEQERDILRNIVEKYRSIVDTRRRTRETYLEKQTVWQQIVEEYNGSENVIMRTEKELKKCWDNMKYRARLAEKEQQRAENDEYNLRNLSNFQIIDNNIKSSMEKILIQNGFNAEDYEYNENVNNSNDGETYKTESKEDEQEWVTDDEQPIVKKARKESPKLSSILLGETKKKSHKVESNNYLIPNCTKVTHFKKSKKMNVNPVSILPKGLNSCLSIMNIPNPNQLESSLLNGSDFSSGSMNIGGGVTISPHKNIFDDTLHSAEILPKSNKVSKNNVNKNCHGDNTDEIEENILLQRMDFDAKEHNLKIKVLEKQLQAHSNEAQYWELKLQLLRNGQESLFHKIVNGNHL